MKKNKRFEVQVYIPNNVHNWFAKRHFNDYDSAVLSCESLRSKYDKTRVFDLFENERVD